MRVAQRPSWSQPYKQTLSLLKSSSYHIFRTTFWQNIIWDLFDKYYWNIRTISVNIYNILHYLNKLFIRILQTQIISWQPLGNIEVHFEMFLVNINAVFCQHLQYFAIFEIILKTCMCNLNTNVVVKYNLN